MSGRKGRIQMRKNLTLCLCTLLLAFGSLAPGSTSAAPPAVGRDGQHHRVIQLTGVSVIAETIDLGNPGLSVGDTIVISDDLFQDGEKVGVHGGTCTVVRVGALLFHCVVTFTLPDGHITAQGLVTPDLAEEQVAVTGGTGAYTTAQGELTVLEEGEGQSRYTFELLLSTSK
jgi:Allene oxide cyclase barrel like domain